MEVLQSTRGKDQIAYRGFLYRLDKRTLSTVLWRCHRSTCTGRLRTTLQYPEGEATERGSHCHGPEPENIGVKAVRDQMLTQAVAGHDPARRILQDAVCGISQETAAQIGSGLNLKRAVSRKRQKLTDFPPHPKNIEELEIPQSLTTSHTGDQFILYDSGLVDRNRIIIFRTNESLSWLVNNRHWLADGTFKVAPELFTQLFTVHCVINHSGLPCVYVLLRNKTEASYTQVWTQL